MELRQFLNTVRKWLWLILLSTLLATVSSFLATRQQQPLYAARTTLMVGRTIENPNPTGNEVQLSQQLARTYAEIAKRKPVREASREALGLNWLPEYTVSLVPNTQLLEIQVTDASPQRAQAVANELGHQLIEQSPSSTDRQQQERRNFVNQQLQDLETNIEGTKSRIEELQGQLADMFSARQIADTQDQITALEQKLNTYQANYTALLGFLEGGVNTLQVVETADLPRTPIGPNKLVMILLVATIGFALALGAAFVLDYLDDTLKTPDDVKEALQLSVLGAITRIKGEEPMQKLIAVRQPKSPIAEAYRILRTNIQFSALDNPPRTLLVTSPHPLEGKSTTLSNLAAVMAQQGQRVVLVDTDLRRPTLHRIFGVPNSTGLTNALLQEQPTADGFLHETDQENLWLLTTGPLPPTPAELLSSSRFAALLEDLKQRADVVLLDSPPTLAVTDAAVLARQVDGVLLVISAGDTRRQWAKAAQEMLQNVGAHVLGVALNQLKTQGGGYSYYYYSNYYAREDGADSPQQQPSRWKPSGWRVSRPKSSVNR